MQRLDFVYEAHDETICYIKLPGHRSRDKVPRVIKFARIWVYSRTIPRHIAVLGHPHARGFNFHCKTA